MPAAQTRTKPDAEDSRQLRALTSLLALVGILAASQLAETPIWITAFGAGGAILGSLFSYKRRHENNSIAKIWISLGIVLVAAAFFRELLVRINLNIADARLPLTNMLIALQGLHCFDLPRRRDLSISSLVGLTLLSSAATLSRDTSFVFYLFSFLVIAVYMFLWDCLSRTQSRAIGYAGTAPIQKIATTPRPSFKPWLKAELLLGPGAFLLLCLACFVLLPKFETSALRNKQFSAGFNLSFLGKDTSWANSLAQLVSPDGSVKSNPKAYYGFAEKLDTNYRGRLGDNVVMHVSCPTGDYWRGMAFDTFDGIFWSMSESKKVFDRYAMSGQMIPVTPVPSLEYGNNVEKSTLTQVFYLEEDASNLVVCASVPVQIYFPSNKVQLDSYGAVRSPIGIQKDMVYTVVSSHPVFDVPRLRRQNKPSPRAERYIKRHFANYLQIPDKIDPSVIDLSKNVAGQGNYFQKAERISRYIQSHYAYDLEAPITKASSDSVSDFLLNSKRGYCESFASAFVIMCRSQGMPARLVTGYMPGEYNPFTGLWEVRLRDAHCWAELFVPSCGWVPFDPTPVGAPPGSSGVNHDSAFDYLSKELARLSAAFQATTLGKELVKAWPLWQLFLESFLFRIWNARQGLVISAFVCAFIASLLLSGKIRSGIFSGKKADKNKKLSKTHGGDNYGTRPARKASLAFEQLLQGLSALDIKRNSDDTSDDLLKKVQIKLTEDKNLALACTNKESLLIRLETFLDDYSEARFGDPAAFSDLNQPARLLKIELQAMARAKSRLPISK